MIRLLVGWSNRSHGHSRHGFASVGGTLFCSASLVCLDCLVALAGKTAGHIKGQLLRGMHAIASLLSPFIPHLTFHPLSPLSFLPLSLLLSLSPPFSFYFLDFLC